MSIIIIKKSGTSFFLQVVRTDYKFSIDFDAVLVHKLFLKTDR